MGPSKSLVTDRVSLHVAPQSYFSRALQGGHLIDGNDVTRTDEGFIFVPLNTDGTEVPLPRLTLTGMWL